MVGTLHTLAVNILAVLGFQFFIWTIHFWEQNDCTTKTNSHFTAKRTQVWIIGCMLGATGLGSLQPLKRQVVMKMDGWNQWHFRYLGECLFGYFNCSRCFWEPSTILEENSARIFDLTSWQNWFSSVKCVGFLAWTHILSKVHKVSIRLKSGLRENHSKSLMLPPFIHFTATFYVCLGSFSCRVHRFVCWRWACEAVTFFLAPSSGHNFTLSKSFKTTDIPIRLGCPVWV